MQIAGYCVPVHAGFCDNFVLMQQVEVLNGFIIFKMALVIEKIRMEWWEVKMIASTNDKELRLID